jgi:dipeptidyl aminopeptidase/acylaminoacyl peptidase
MNAGKVLLLGLVWLVPATGCGKKQDGSAPVGASARAARQGPLPELGPAKTLEPGVLFHEVTLPGQPPEKVWIYLPAKPAEAKLPCVLVGPAGSTLLDGMDLGEGDRPEHLPYVRAGFAVVSYDIAGNVPQGASDAQFVAGVKQFMAAQAGLADARDALDYALAKVPAIDPERIYTAGHSSAATLSLLVAAHDPRIKACVAYAPCTDVPGRVAKLLPQLERSVPGVTEFAKDSSPRTHVAKLRCPVFLFHANDDNNVPVSESVSFEEELKRTNSNVTLVRTARGGHHDSMIREGIPSAIQWLKLQAKK